MAKNQMNKCADRGARSYPFIWEGGIQIDVCTKARKARVIACLQSLSDFKSRVGEIMKTSKAHKVEVYVRTRKGGFLLRSDQKRKNWKMEGPFFAGTKVNCLMRDHCTGKYGKVVPFFNPPPPDPTWVPTCVEFQAP